MATHARLMPSHGKTSWMTLTRLLIFSLYCTSVSGSVLSPSRTVKPRAEMADGVELRVLPIGDSITWGAHSTDETGYRNELHNLLAANGNMINFVGGTHSGQMKDNDHEGHRGYVIDEIRQASSVGVYAAANIVLVHAGTNDMKNQIDPPNAPSRLKTLIDYIYVHSPKAAVFVCQIIPSGPAQYPGTSKRIPTFNKAIPGLVDDYVKDGKHVTLVDMNSAVSTNDLFDGLHPNDHGYSLMAHKYYDAIVAADKKGWIVPPGKSATAPGNGDGGDPAACEPSPSWLRIGEIASGAKVATTDGPFKPAFKKIGVVAEGKCPGSQVHFPDLDGDGLRDYVCVDPKTGSVSADLNIPDANGKTSGNWKKLGKVVDPQKARAGTGVQFADLNGDGKDDYIWVDPDTGNVSGWINRGQKDGVWAWQSLGVIAANGQAKNTTLQMVDIDGDGRADYCLVDQTTGQVKGWLNRGTAPVPDYYELGVIATGVTASKGDTVILGDLTGEGRADYMIVGEGGKTTALVNNVQETSMIPRWLEPFTFAEGPEGVKQDQVRLVDLTGDGKVDYLAVDAKSGKVTLWENIGTGGKYQKGDGVFLCDLDGDGTNDYFWLDHTGKGWGYLNTGKGKNEWNPLGEIATGDHDRNQVRMGALTKSGRADYIVVNETDGRATWYENKGQDKGWTWGVPAVAARGPRDTIESQWGWKFNGKNVRFVDLDQDGVADYLYINETGAVVMYRNLGVDSQTREVQWGLPHLVAEGVGAAPRDIQFSDTNGDGRMDYNVVDRVTGRTDTWRHLGFRDDESIRWNKPQSFADGTGSIGPAIRLAEMTGDIRGDYVSVDPDTGRLNLWKNRCDPINDGGDGGSDGGDGGGGDGGGGDGGNNGGGDGGGDNNPIPIVTGDGRCAGPDCVNGQCTGILCISYGCKGNDCHNGKCDGEDCIPLGCAGSNCKDGMCYGSGCVTNGCVGPHCDKSHHRCSGLSCISIGCKGLSCLPDGGCSGPRCTIQTCSGPECFDGGCIDSGCLPGSGGSSAGGEEGDGDDDEDECTTTTFSTCGTFCTALPTTTACSSACSELEACTTETDWSSTVTLAPAYTVGTMEMWNSPGIPETGLPDVAHSVIAFLSSIGDFDHQPTKTTSHKPTSTSGGGNGGGGGSGTDLPFPTINADSDTRPYCFRDHNTDHSYSQMTQDEVDQWLDDFCATTNDLAPDNDYGFLTAGEPLGAQDGLLISLRWAESQKGCQPKKGVSVKTLCDDLFGDLEKKCDDGDSDDNYGGGLVGNRDYGCVRAYFGQRYTDN